MSDEDILKAGIRSFKKSAASVSNGVERNSIPAMSHSTFNCSYSFFQNLSYFLKSST